MEDNFHIRIYFLRSDMFDVLTMMSSFGVVNNIVDHTYARERAHINMGIYKKFFNLFCLHVFCQIYDRMSNILIFVTITN